MTREDARACEQVKRARPNPPESSTFSTGIEFSERTTVEIHAANTIRELLCKIYVGPIDSDTRGARP